MRLKDVI